METKEIKIRDLRTNNGQLEGVPRNPRKISKKQLEKLEKSLTDAPEMLRPRELICVEHPDGTVVIFSVCESETISAMDAQKEVGKAIYGKGYIVSEKAAAEKAAAQRWQLSDREKQIIQKLNNHAKE